MSGCCAKRAPLCALGDGCIIIDNRVGAIVDGATEPEALTLSALPRHAVAAIAATMIRARADSVRNGDTRRNAFGLVWRLAIEPSCTVHDADLARRRQLDPEAGDVVNNCAT